MVTRVRKAPVRGVRARPGALSWCPVGRSRLLGLLSPAGHKKRGGCDSRPGRSDAKRGGGASSARLLVCGRGLPAAKTKGPGARLPLARGVPGHPRIVAVDLGDDFAGSPESLPLSRVLPGGVGHRFVSFRVDGAVCSHHEGTPATGRRGGSRSGARPQGRGTFCLGCTSSGAERAGASTGADPPAGPSPADLARHGKTTP